MKRFLEILCVFTLMVSNCLPTYAAGNAPSLTVDTVTAEAGASVEVPIRLSGNTGICGATLTVTYDDALTLTGIEKGDALSSLTMTKPGNMSANPFRIVWDGTDNDTTEGVIAVLTFTAPTAEGTYNIEVSSDGEVFDSDINLVELDITNGAVQVGQTVTPDEPEKNNPVVTVAAVTAEAGENVEVPIVLSGNTGICGATLSVTYDEALTLTGIVKGDALSSLTMTKPGNMSANPFRLVWDGTDNDTTNGTLAVLTFTAPAEAGTYDVTVSYEEGDVLDSELNSVILNITNGTIEVTEEEVKGLLGDVNRDGTVDTSDAQAIFNHFMGIAQLSDDVLPFADINEDGSVDTSDAQAVFNIFMGII